MIRTLVLAIFPRRQPVIRRARVRIAQQRRQRIIPLALRASPSLKCSIRSPDKFPGSLLSERSMVVTTVHDEATLSRTCAFRWPWDVCRYGSANKAMCNVPKAVRSRMWRPTPRKAKPSISAGMAQLALSAVEGSVPRAKPACKLPIEHRLCDETQTVRTPVEERRFSAA